MDPCRRLVLATVIALPMLGAGVVDAKDTVVIDADPSQRALSDAQVQSLGPVVNPLQAPDTSAVVADTEPGPYAAGAMTREGMVPSTRAFGSFGIPYTTTRVQDGARSVGVGGAARLSTTYPYRTVGKLTFSAGYCSASLIRRSVIVTAAHCIQDFGTWNSHLLELPVQARPLRCGWRNSGADRALRNMELARAGAPGDLGQRHRHRHRARPGTTISR